MEIYANAKINLALDVLGEREDGYHEVDMIMQELDLHDVINIEQGRGGFALTCDNADLPLDEDNLVYKVWKLLQPLASNDSVVIEIEKNIPIAAGLAGGSTDAAATLVGLNRMWSLGLSDKELMEYACKIGSDVPFFINGGTQRAQGRGEILTKLESYTGKYVVLVNNGEHISTRFVYEKVNRNGNIKIDELIKAMEINSRKAFSYMENQLETVSFEIHPKLAEIKEEMLKMGASISLMSGSGPTIFGIFDRYEAAEKAYQLFKEKYKHVFLTHTI